MTPMSPTASTRDAGARCKPRIRLSIVRAARRAHRSRRVSRVVLEGLSDSLFPATYFLHNLMALTREPWWRRLPVRIQRYRWSGMLVERCNFFLEVRKWTTERSDQPSNGLRAAGCGLRAAGKSTSEKTDQSSETSAQAKAQVTETPSHYCTHCGGCCEIASGLPEFPSPNPIPPSWWVAFGEGLGKGHRFCPFLWELDGSGNSVCAIHPWRPNPCRLFERDECEIVLQDADYLELSRPDSLRKGFRSLRQLLGCRLPVGLSATPA